MYLYLHNAIVTWFIEKGYADECVGLQVIEELDFRFLLLCFFVSFFDGGGWG